MNGGELRKRRTAQEAGLPDAVEQPQIQSSERREVPDVKVHNPRMLHGVNRVGQKEKGFIPSIGDYLKWDRPVERTSLIAIILFTIAALATRFYRISMGDFVV